MTHISWYSTAISKCISTEVAGSVGPCVMDDRQKWNDT